MGSIAYSPLNKNSRNANKEDIVMTEEWKVLKPVKESSHILVAVSTKTVVDIPFNL